MSEIKLDPGKLRTLMKIAKKTKKAKGDEGRWYNGNSLLGHDWAMFYMILGAGATGKSYWVMKHVAQAKFKNPKKHKVFWCRLTETQCAKMLEDNAAKMLDPDLYRKFGKELKRKGNVVKYGYTESKETKTGKIQKRFVTEGEFAQVQPLSTFFNNKGEALFDNEFTGEYWIILDEMNREAGEANRFDVVEAFANQLENFTRQAKCKIRVICIGNNMEEVSDILAAFNFIPRGYGRFKLKRRKCIIDVIEPTAAYEEDRAQSAGYILAPNAKRFAKTNGEIDNKLVATPHEVRAGKPQVILCFTKTPQKWFVLNDNNIISKWNKETKPQMAMARYIGMPYQPDYVLNIENRYNMQNFRYDNYSTYILFTKAMALNKKK
jgi:hypothetical protein